MFFQSPQKQTQSAANETVVINESVVTATNESMTSLTTVSVNDKDDQDEESICECNDETIPSSGSPPSTAKSKTSDAVLKKQAESMEAQAQQGTSKARPIPEMPNYEVPRDPDKDSPNVVVSIEQLNH